MKRKTLKEQQDEYKRACEIRQARIKAEPSKFKRFWKWVGYFVAFPFVWAFANLKDWRTIVIFAIVAVVLAGSVWIFYLAGIMCGGTNTDTGKWLIGIGSAVWVWWLSPAGSPYILLCVSITIGIKAIFNRFKQRKKDKQ